MLVSLTALACGATRDTVASGNTGASPGSGGAGEGALTRNGVGLGLGPRPAPGDSAYEQLERADRCRRAGLWLLRHAEMSIDLDIGIYVESRRTRGRFRNRSLCRCGRSRRPSGPRRPADRVLNRHRLLLPTQAKLAGSLPRARQLQHAPRNQELGVRKPADLEVLVPEGAVAKIDARLQVCEGDREQDPPVLLAHVEFAGLSHDRKARRTEGAEGAWAPPTFRLDSAACASALRVKPAETIATQER